MHIAFVSAAVLIALGACSQGEPPAAPSETTAPATVESPAGPEGQTLAQFQARIADGFAGLDADGDGVVTAVELNDASGGMAAPMLARLDADRDGRVTRDEMAAGAERMFGRMDANGDGVISPDERPAIGAVRPQG